MAPALLATLIPAIGGVVGSLFKAKGAKNRASAEEGLRKQTYEDDVRVWLEQQQAIEQDRQRKISLYAAYAKGNNMDTLLTPEMLATLAKPKPVVQPAPYRSGGVAPGSTWDMLGMGLEGASSAFGAYQASKMNPLDIMKKARLGGIAGKMPKPGGTPLKFGSGVKFGGSTTWDAPW